jgi:alpha-beta hydrolase superfamily lysophospholipase
MRIIKDLTNRDNTRRRSEELAELIRDYKSKFPERRIYVIAKSAGTAPAVMALSQLENDTVERAFLLSPAISPEFDLSRALGATKQELYSFWSPHDHFWLGLGTSLFGTADGVTCRAAGLTGFKRPDDPRQNSQYEKLKEIEWTPSMLLLGHLGGHPGNSMPPFIRKYILPLLS